MKHDYTRHQPRSLARQGSIVLVLLLLLSLLARGRAAADDGQKAAEDDPDKARTVKLVLSPVAEPRPALRYQLLPGMLDRKPGNAAVMYNKAIIMLLDRLSNQTAQAKSEWEKMCDSLDVPLAQFPRDEARKTLEDFKYVLDEVSLAALRERCDWELPIRERNFISLLLPELQRLRDLGRLLALRARLQIAEGRVDDALHTLQSGFALGRNAARGPTLIHGLVGIAICQMMSQQLQELLQQPGAPNLYWAFTTLPQPLIDLRPGIETEMNMLYLSFPALRQLNDTMHSPAYWQHLLDELEASVTEGLGMQLPKAGLRPLLTILAIKGYPTARDGLIAQGRPRAEVEAMPVAQVLMLYTMQTYNQERDEWFKWLYVPYWQAVKGMEEVKKKFVSEGRSKEVVPLASLLLPAVHGLAGASARNERGIAALRTVEALRIYAAAHEGRLPEKLADITAVPVPIDPMTGQAFTYHKTGETAVLESPPPPGRTPRDYGLRYEITMQH